MSATTVEIQRARTRSATGKRIAALAGPIFALCFFVGVAMLETPRGATDRELVAWWSDGSNQARAIASMYLFVLAGLCFLVLLVRLRSRLLPAEGGAGELTTLLVAAGVLFVAMLWVAAVSRGVIAFAVRSPVNEESLPGADTLRYVPQLGYAATGTAGLLAGAVTMATTSWLVLRTRVFGRWLAWLGGLTSLAVVVASAALAGVLAIPAMLVWALAVGVALWRSSDEATDGRTRQ